MYCASSIRIHVEDDIDTYDIEEEGQAHVRVGRFHEEEDDGELFQFLELLRNW